MKNNTTTFELNPVVFSKTYIETHLLPVIQPCSDDETFVKVPFLEVLTQQLVISPFHHTLILLKEA